MASIVTRTYADGSTRYQAKIRRKNTPTLSRVFNTKESAQRWVDSVELTLQEAELVISADQWRLLAQLAKLRTKNTATLIGEAVTHFLNEAIQRGEIA